MNSDTLKQLAEAKGIEYDGATYKDPEIPDITRNDAGDYLFTWQTVNGEYMRIKAADPEITSKSFDVWLSVMYKPHENAKPRTLMAMKHWNTRSVSSTNQLSTALNRWKITVNWHERLEAVSDHLESNFETGDPFVWLDEVEDPGPVEYLLRPLIQKDQHNAISAKGGSLKSMTALALFLSVASGRPIIPGLEPSGEPLKCLYLDYETNAPTHSRRLHGMARAKGIEVPRQMIGYKRLATPLVQMKAELYRLIKLQGFQFVVVDAAGRATGGETVSEADVQAYYNACSTFGITVLTIAHPSKMGSGIAGNDQWRNQARNLWLIEAAQEPGSNAVVLGLHHDKMNEGEKEPSLTYAVTFSGTNVSYSKATASDRKMLDNTDVPTQVLEYLAENPNSTAAQIAVELDKTSGRINNLLSGTLTNKGLVKHDGRSRDRKWSLTHPVNNGVSTGEEDSIFSPKGRENTSSPSHPEGTQWWIEEDEDLDA